MLEKIFKHNLSVLFCKEIYNFLLILRDLRINGIILRFFSNLGLYFIYLEHILTTDLRFSR